MLEKYINTPYQHYFVKPVANLAYRISPNKVTLLACLIGLLVPVLCLFHAVYAAVIGIIVSGYLDTLDGYLARLQDAQSDFGSILDIVSDRIVEAAIVLGIFLIDPVHRASLSLGILAGILICVTSFLVVGIFIPHNNMKSFYYHLGLIDRPEAFCFFIAMLLLPTWFNVLAISFIILVLLTAFLRLLAARKLLLN